MKSPLNAAKVRSEPHVYRFPPLVFVLLLAKAAAPMRFSTHCRELVQYSVQLIWIVLLL